MEAINRHTHRRTEHTEMSRAMHAPTNLPPSEAFSDECRGEIVEVGPGGT